MKSIDRIPITKIQRASKLVGTGTKVGINYLKYYGDKLINTEEEAKERLDKKNAEDIYDSLKQLKGSALKVAQMLSMEKSFLPKAYVEQFSLSQFSVPPLSAPLVKKTFINQFGKSPFKLFDTFNEHAMNAASIGQVHYAEKDGHKYAVKIQYPGVADSISSDLALVKPIALRMFNIPSKDSDKYFKEVEEKLLEETNYIQELDQSQFISNACKHIPNLRFPNYHKSLSNSRILTMDYMEGVHLASYCKTNTDEKLNKMLGQALWDFFMFQIHHLKMVHADPHPGNFLVSNSGKLIVLDFGCIKKIPLDFYIPYFELAQAEVLNNEDKFENKLFELEILMESDSEEEKLFFKKMFKDLLKVFTKPFHNETFDFSDQSFFKEVINLGELYAKNSEIRKYNSNRGSKHFIYINRMFFGLYNLMFDLKAKDVTINNYVTLID
ncbi:ABC1 kinase family protein [Aegicerativicinus sediminis]|uniref:ABC1 kinase family protein n=1 Tax=Aegicerativicinus sediminis TaxID=2893202 RepID=UPI001E52F6A2|nr:lipopolysaccharide core heptose(II) kinase RfaY [Aegicerativicinus sediminis]